MSNYTYDWGLKDYLDYSKNFTDYFPKHKVKNINEIKYKENKKIRIAFVYKNFKANTLDDEFTLQKLVNRSMDLYVLDTNFKEKIQSYDKLIPSGSRL